MPSSMRWLVLGLRNLGRRPMRTGLTASMIAGGTLLVVFSIGLAEGTYDMMTDLATRSSVGHLQALRAGFHEKPALRKTLHDLDAARRALAAQPNVAGTAARLEAGGLFAAGNRTVGGMLVGVEPEAERTVSSLPDAVSEGAWLPTTVGPDDPLPVVLTKHLAGQLKVKLGGEISYVGQGADGSIAAELFVVRGIADLGAAAPMAAVRLSDAQELLVLPGRAHRVVAAVSDLAAVADTGEAVAGLADGDVAMTWSELLPTLARSIEADRSSSRVFLAIVLAVVLLGVANTMLMAVYERTRELGVLAALGTTPRQLVALILAEAFWLSLVAVGAGVLVGAGINAWIGVSGIPLGAYAVDFGGVMLDRMPAVNTFESTVELPLIIVAAGVLSALLPALRASRMKPTEALRP